MAKQVKVGNKSFTVSDRVRVQAGSVKIGDYVRRNLDCVRGTPTEFGTVTGFEGPFAVLDNGARCLPSFLSVEG